MYSIKQTLGLWIVVTGALLIAACAAGAGGTGNGDDDDDDVVDARRIDAPQVIDAPLPIDARIIDAPLPIDAPIIPIDAAPLGTVQTGDPCALTTDCAVQGDCCVFGKMICEPGTEPIPGFCFPS